MKYILVLILPLLSSSSFASSSEIEQKIVGIWTPPSTDTRSPAYLMHYGADGLFLGVYFANNSCSKPVRYIKGIWEIIGERINLLILQSNYIRNNTVFVLNIEKISSTDLVVVDNNNVKLTAVKRDTCAPREKFQPLPTNAKIMFES